MGRLTDVTRHVVRAAPGCLAERRHHFVTDLRVAMGAD